MVTITQTKLWKATFYQLISFGGLALCLMVAGVVSADENKRVALVIGNSKYQHVTSLINPANDAEDISNSLERIGFQVTTGKNLDYNGMRLAVRDFTEAAADADVVMIYFAGHGIEIENTNYLIPVNATLKSDRDVEFEAIRLDAIVNAIADTPGLKIVLVDACRNNPFVAQMKRVSTTRSIGRGLAAIEPGGVVVGYAARGGTLAEDGDGRNSPYAKALLEHIEQPGLELGKMFRRIRDRVYDLTDGFQEPFTYGSLPGEDIYLVPKIEKVAMVAPTTQQTMRATQAIAPVPLSRADVMAAAMEINTLRGWSLYAAKYGPQAITEPEVVTRMYEMTPKWAAKEKGNSVLEDLITPDPNSRKEIQAALNETGFDVGIPDGAFGSKTRAGIRAVQLEKGLPETGFVDPGVVVSIGLDWKKYSNADFISSPFADRQYPERLAMLGEYPEIIAVLGCLGLRKSIYGVFRGSFYVALIQSGHVQLARAEAEKCGVDLATITSDAENRFVVKMFSSDPSFVDVGYDSKSKISYKSGPYFGLRKDPGESDAVFGWRWYSGEPVKYTNWLPSKPNKNHGTKKKQYAQFQYEKRGRTDLRNAVAAQWFDGSGIGRSFILEGALQ
ncbi:caspase family protein [Sulfitobacter sp. SK011]|uniref:caspase family protein n=1 Tax=Sulfitobacter sp. SK011 TaxID=1389004 RepID=UPI000E0C68F6|nr:caspase family protein [Sulfitobacter sp. SK011]AXI41349.1 hypothetical protein C1J02_04775 [Sulfitobacter sp. SK011]